MEQNDVACGCVSLVRRPLSASTRKDHPMRQTFEEINERSDYVKSLYMRRDTDPAAKLAADLLDRLATKGDGEPFYAAAYEGIRRDNPTVLKVLAALRAILPA